MKKIGLFILSAFLLASCATSLPGKIDNLADKVETKGASYTLEQWEKSNVEFEKLIDDYIENYDKYSIAEKKEINAAIGRYSAAALKSGAQDVASEVEDMLDELPGNIDALVEGAKGFLEGLGL